MWSVLPYQSNVQGKCCPKWYKWRSANLLEMDVRLQLFNLWKEELLQHVKRLQFNSWKELLQHVKICGTMDSFLNEEKLSINLFCDKLHQTFNLKLSRTCSFCVVWGFCDPQICTLCRFTLPKTWKVASSEKKIVDMKSESAPRLFICEFHSLSLVIWLQTLH